MKIIITEQQANEIVTTTLNDMFEGYEIKFEGDLIEYCLSIVFEDDQVLINYRTWDRTTRIGVYDKNYIDSLLVYN